MAFIVEDGTGVVDANALISVSDFDDYLLDRNEPNTFTVEEKQAAIVSASVDFIDTFFTFAGTAINPLQGLQLPTDDVPMTTKIVRAACMAALLDTKGRLFVNPTDLQQKAVIETEEKLDVLSEKVVYSSDGGGYTTKYPTTAIDRLLKPYLVSGGSMGNLVRN